MLRAVSTILLAIFVATSGGSALARDGANDGADAARATAPPRLVVVIAVDQLRPDYLHHLREHFVPGGFRRFLDEGAWFTQARYLHATTATCPGHTVVMTGSHASTNGILANEWWNLAEGRAEYCARDDDAPLIGLAGEGRSPKNLIGSTVGDELKLATAGRGRVITISGKDRTSIMLGGHLADAAYFIQDTLAVTSTYYMDALPEWARRFNASGLVTGYFGEVWDRVLPADVYARLGPDDEPGERLKPGFTRSFPHTVDGGETAPGRGFVEALEASPFHNELVVAFAMEAVRNEGLGADDVPDILGIGFSANDRIGHSFGAHSHEVMDVTLRTDRLLAELFAALDEEVGLEHVVVVLTSDHGVAPMPEIAARMNPRTGARRLPPATVRAAAEEALTNRFGAPATASWVAAQRRPWLYLDPEALAAAGVPAAEVEAEAVRALDAFPGVSEAWTRTRLTELRDAGVETPILLSFHPARSGHVAYVVEPWVVEQPESDGTNHGSPWAYDQHVPLLWYGAGIRPGTYHGNASVSDIAPTLSAILGIARPTGARGRVLEEAVR